MSHSDITRLIESKFAQLEAREKARDHRLDKLVDSMEEMKLTVGAIDQVHQAMDTSFIFEATLSESSRAYLLILNLLARKKLRAVTSSEMERQFKKSIQDLLFQSLVDSNMAFLNQEEAAEGVEWALEVSASVTRQVRETDYETQMMSPDRSVPKQREENSASPADQIRENTQVASVNDTQIAPPPSAPREENKENVTTNGVVDEDSLERDLPDDESFVSAIQEFSPRRKSGGSFTFNETALQDFGSNFVASTPQVNPETTDLKKSRNRVNWAKSAIDRNPQSLSLTQLDVSAVVGSPSGIETSSIDDDTLVPGCSGSTGASTSKSPGITIKPSNAPISFMSRLPATPTTIDPRLLPGTPEFIERQATRRTSFMARVEAKKLGETSPFRSPLNTSRTFDPNETFEERKERKKAELCAPNPGCSYADRSTILGATRIAETSTATVRRSQRPRKQLNYSNMC